MQEDFSEAVSRTKEEGLVTYTTGDEARRHKAKLRFDKLVTREAAFTYELVEMRVKRRATRGSYNHGVTDMVRNDLFSVLDRHQKSEMPKHDLAAHYTMDFMPSTTVPPLKWGTRHTGLGHDNVDVNRPGSDIGNDSRITVHQKQTPE